MMALLVVAACVDPISLQLSDGAGALVVDGMITDESNVHIIKLSRSIDFRNDQPLRIYPIPETDAIVEVSDNEGNSATAIELQPGVYRLDGLEGKVGNRYVLDITTSNGKRYRSEPEEMKAAVAPDRIEFEFKFYQNSVITTNRGSVLIPLDGFFIYAIVNDPPERGNYYMWRSEGQFEFFSLTDHDTLKQCWAPHPERLESGIELTDDTFTNGNLIRQFICIVPYNRPTHFLVAIKQYSLSERAHEFWKRSAAQHVATGSLMDPPPAMVQGNVFSLDDGDEPVLGYFGASAVIKTNYLLNRLRDAGMKPPAREIPIRLGNCKLQEPGATNKKPAGF